MHELVTRPRPLPNARTPKASRRRAVKSERILAAAVKLFTHKAYGAVTMDRVAQIAKVAKGTLYLYFNSKEALYLALPNAGFNTLFRTLQSIDPGADVATRLRRAIEITFQFYEQHSNLLSLLAAGEPPAAGQRLIERSRRRGLEFFRSLIEEGMQAGVFRRADSRLAVLVIMGAIRSALLYYGSSRKRAELSADLSRMFLHALASAHPMVSESFGIFR